eukprot:SM000105S13907  [mRNA]  locus=s105:464071:468628:- [translate_table: standard]
MAGARRGGGGGGSGAAACGDGGDGRLRCIANNEAAGAALVRLLPLAEGGLYHVQVSAAAAAAATAVAAAAGAGDGAPPAQYLACHNRELRLVRSRADAAHFSIGLFSGQFVSLHTEGGFVTCSPEGRMWCGTRVARAWERFQLVPDLGDGLPGCTAEACQPISGWSMRAPVRVNLRAHTGKYLCSAHPVLNARAETACCCEEFLLDLKPPPLLLASGSCNCDLCGAGSSGEDEDSWSCAVRTGEGRHMWTVEGSGQRVLASEVSQARGREAFVLELEGDGRGGTSEVALRFLPGVKQGAGSCSRSASDSSGPPPCCYLSAERRGIVACDRPRAQRWERFCLEFADLSHVLIQSPHGALLSVTPEPPMISVATSAWNGSGLSGRRDLQQLDRSCSWASQAGEPRGSMDEAVHGAAWQLRAHGDSHYTLVAVPAMPPGAGDSYLYVDSAGQSSEPSLHFPAVASLFKIVPERVGEGRSVAGFSIRTVRKIHGKERYLTAEPNGAIMARRLTVGHWEVFRLIDVDAAAAQVEQLAAPTQRPNDVLRGGPALAWPATPDSRGTTNLLQGQHEAIVETTLALRESAASTVQAAAMKSVAVLTRLAAAAEQAIVLGIASPTPSPASLLNLCLESLVVECARSGVVCTDRALLTKPLGHVEHEDQLSSLQLLLKEEGAISHEELLFPFSIPAFLLAADVCKLPSELQSQVWRGWRSRQSPAHSCKWRPGPLHLSANPYRPFRLLLSTNASHHQAAANLLAPSMHHGPAWRSQLSRPLAALPQGGWHCTMCYTGGHLPLDPALNPAHYRFLELQFHVRSAAAHPTGVLWNFISMAGVSLLTAAMCLQLL